MCVLKTNVVGPYLTTKYLLPLLMKKKTRVIVNTSSLYDAMNATYDDPEGHHNPTGSVLLPSNSSKAALNMRKFPATHDDKAICVTPLVLSVANSFHGDTVLVWKMLTSAQPDALPTAALSHPYLHSISCGH